MTFNLAKRARESAMTGFTLNNALAEALGAASVCWTPKGVFESEQATAILVDLRDAIMAFTQIAINQQAIDARCGWADWEIAELIFQAPVMDFDQESTP